MSAPREYTVTMQLDPESRALFASVRDALQAADDIVQKKPDSEAAAELRSMLALFREQLAEAAQHVVQGRVDLGGDVVSGERDDA